MIKVFIATVVVFLVLKVLMDFQYIKKENANRIILFFMLFVTMFSQQDAIGSDDYNYRLVTLSYIDQPLYLEDVFRREGGFYLLQWLVGNIFGFTQPLIMLEAFFIVYVYYYLIVKYSSNPFLSLFILCISGFLGSILNISRQYLAVSIILWFAYRFIVERQFAKYCVCVLVAMWFHTSAIIMIPFYWILQLKPSYRTIIMSLAVTSIILATFSSLGGLLSADSKYQYVLVNNSMNYLRALKDVVVCSVILIYGMPDDVPEEKNMMYMAVMISGCLSLVATANLYIARLALYFSVFTVILLPEIFENKLLNYKKSLILIVIILFTIFGYVQDGRSDFYHNVILESLEYGESFGARFLE